MNKEQLEMYGELVIATQECQDGDIKKLAEGILVLVKNYDNQTKEIERLMTIEQSNNVIFLIGAYTEVLDKLQELKRK